MNQMISDPVISLWNLIPFIVPSHPRFQSLQTICGSNIHSSLSSNVLRYILRFTWFNRILTFRSKTIRCSFIVHNKKIHRRLINKQRFSWKKDLAPSAESHRSPHQRILRFQSSDANRQKSDGRFIGEAINETSSRAQKRQYFLCAESEGEEAHNKTRMDHQQEFAKQAKMPLID